MMQFGPIQIPAPATVGAGFKPALADIGFNGAVRI